MSSPQRWRGRTAWVLLVVGCLALLLANVAVFLRLFVFDTDTFADAVAPKEPDPQVVTALSDTLTTRLVDSAAVQQRIEDLTPDDNALVAEVISSSAQNLLRSIVQDVLESDTFRSIYRTAVEKAHGAFIDIVDDDSSRPVVMNLTTLVQQVDERLEARGIDLLDDATTEQVGEVVAVRRAQIGEVREGLELVRKLSVVLVILSLVLLAAAILLATDRRKMLARLGVGMALAMVVTGIALRVARGIVLDRFEMPDRRAAVESLWGRVFAELDRQTGALLVLGLVLVVGAWLIGPSRTATALRERVNA